MIHTIKLSIALLILSLSGLTYAANSSSETTQEIAPGVYNFTSGNHYYSMFVITDNSVVVFETVNSNHATALIEAIGDITDLPIKYAFQSHNHWDHSNGGKVMQEAGAQTVMHQLAAQWLEANMSRDSSKPNIIWQGKRRDFKVDNITVELHYLGMNHGLGMTVFVIPELSVGYIADLVTPNRVMFNIVPDFNIKEWERSLSEILELDFDIAVCSHNELPGDEGLDGCTKKHVEEERAYIQDLRNAIFAEFKKGTPAGEIPSSVRLPQYAHWKYYDEWLEMNARRVLLDLWMGPYPWIPENN